MQNQIDTRVERVAALLHRLHTPEFLAMHGSPVSFARCLKVVDPDGFGRLVHFADALEYGAAFGPDMLRGQSPHADGRDM